MAYKKNKWRTIYSVLKQRIEEGTYPAGSEFPTNKDIGHEFNAYNHTVNTAVSKLIQEGLVNSSNKRATRRTVRKQLNRSKIY